MKLPRLELIWLKAQREKITSKSMLSMGRVDGGQLKILKARVAREARREANASTSYDLTEDFEISPDVEQQVVSVVEDSEYTSLTRLSTRDASVQTNKLNVNDLMNTSQTSMIRRGGLDITPAVEGGIRFGVSSAATAAIINGTIKALINGQYLHPDFKAMCVDTARVTRCKDKTMSAAESEIPSMIKCIFIDGRKDDRLAMRRNPETGRHHRTLINENHISVTAEPDGVYVHHFTPPPKTRQAKPAKQAATALHSWLVSQGVDEHLECIGCDTTSEMSGHKGGIVTLTEELLGRRVFRVLCWLHLNELPLRHLMEALDGGTNSKDGWKGEIGMVNKYWLLNAY